MMGSCVFFKSLTCYRRSKKDRDKRKPSEDNPRRLNCKNISNRWEQSNEEAAAIRIQSAFRAYRARSAYRQLKVVLRFQGVKEGDSVETLAKGVLNHIDQWSRMQAEVRARRVAMVVDSQTRRKNLEKKMKLEAKHHESEVKWSNDPKSMEEILNRIQQREEATARRERAMAYAFSHQWRANPDKYLGQPYFDVSKESWGWSWKQHWVAVRPWEIRHHTRSDVAKRDETKHKKSVSGSKEAPRTSKQLSQS